MIQRDLAERLKHLIKTFPIVSLTGPRQSGKTTLLRALFPDRRYYNLENLDERAMIEEDIRGFLSRCGNEGVIIDEAQKVPELFSYLQQTVDNSNIMGQFILSGSQNFLLMENITQSLAGRVKIEHLFPLSLQELGKAGVDLSRDEYIFRGMYPAIYDRKIAPFDYYPSYLQTYIERDVRSLKNIGNLNSFRRFLQLCAGRTGQIVNHSSLANDLGIDHKTVKSWLSVLEASFVIFLLPPHFRNFNKRVIKQSKLYFHDTGLVCSLLGIKSKKELASHYLKGGLFENFIISEYRKASFNQFGDQHGWYFRDRTGNEVDLIIERAGKIFPVEIKAGETISQSFFKGLQKYQSISGVSTEDSFLVYGGEQQQVRKQARVLGWRDTGALCQL